MNSVEVWQSSQTCRLFIIWSGGPWAMLMTPNVIASFMLQWHKWDTISTCFTSCRRDLVYGTYPVVCRSPDNLCSCAPISIVWGWSWSSPTNVCTLLFTSIQVRPGCFFTPFSFLCCSTFSKRCVLPAAAYIFDRSTYQQHFQPPIQKFI